MHLFTRLGFYGSAGAYDINAPISANNESKGLGSEKLDTEGLDGRHFRRRVVD